MRWGGPPGADGSHTISVKPGNHRFSVHCGVESEPQAAAVAADETVELEFILDTVQPEDETCTG